MRTKMLDSKKIDEFKNNLRGELIQPGDANYDEACKVYNGMIHKSPRMICPLHRCTRYNHCC